ncbi:peptide ABC transporter substrate-binding protein [Haloactinomyces albus]|uniref:Oligopeptide transport system substrate-binding protein n=1 Tax=Haloactinomyces albus TaxID=1352928 RepID=A0AAE3ZFN7_9ACTN|nr:ABC transporter substrate-binding protein [Haloactinomyces albus]MDR7302689.1 oligopeptide transport system substrate-binding protein [Haloactinomyces albus]
MRKRRMVAPVAATLAVGLLASACGGGGGGVTEATGTLKDPITVQWGEPQSELVPTNSNDTFGSQVLNPMFTGLIEYTPKSFEARNAMAKSIALSKDKKTYTVEIKQGWKFHNGEEVTADNFVRAWNYGAYAPNGQQNAAMFNRIQGYKEVHPADPDGESGPKKPPKPTAKKMSGLKVVDDHTFTITLQDPFSVFPTKLGYQAFVPLPDTFFTNREKFVDHPVGNGPYKFESRTPSESLTLTRYKDYKGEDAGSVDAVKLLVYNKVLTAYQDLKSGNVDVINTIPTSALANGRWKQELGERAISRERMGITVLNLPMYQEKFKDPNLRKALSLAIDRKKIVKQVFNGEATVADGWSAPGIPGRTDGACGQWCTYNPSKAKELLKKAGGFEGTLTLSYNADGAHKQWMTAVAGSIRDTLGIKVGLNAVPTFSTYQDQMDNNEMVGPFRYGWVADYPTPRTFLKPLYSTGGSANNTGYSSKKFDDLIAQGDQAASVKKANELYGKAEQQLGKDLPSIPLFTQTVKGAKSNRLAEGTLNTRTNPAITTFKVAEPQQ